MNSAYSFVITEEAAKKLFTDIQRYIWLVVAFSTLEDSSKSASVAADRADCFLTEFNKRFGNMAKYGVNNFNDVLSAECQVMNRELDEARAQLSKAQERLASHGDGNCEVHGWCPANPYTGVCYECEKEPTER